MYVTVNGIENIRTPQDQSFDALMIGIERKTRPIVEQIDRECLDELQILVVDFDRTRRVPSIASPPKSDVLRRLRKIDHQSARRVNIVIKICIPND